MRSQVTLLLIFMLLSEAFSLQCHTCDTRGCSGNQTCSGNQDQCYTSTVTSINSKATVKGCTDKTACEAARKFKASKDVDKKVSCCEGDLCNSSESFTLRFLLVVFPLLPSIFF